MNGLSLRLTASGQGVDCSSTSASFSKCHHEFCKLIGDNHRTLLQYLESNARGKVCDSEQQLKLACSTTILNREQGTHENLPDLFNLDNIVPITPHMIIQQAVVLQLSKSTQFYPFGLCMFSSTGALTSQNPIICMHPLTR